jgi:hypothetical protein
MKENPEFEKKLEECQIWDLLAELYSILRRRQKFYAAVGLRVVAPNWPKLTGWANKFIERNRAGLCLKILKRVVPRLRRRIENLEKNQVTIKERLKGGLRDNIEALLPKGTRRLVLSILVMRTKRRYAIHKGTTSEFEIDKSIWEELEGFVEEPDQGETK